jgi:hypothetical protein
MSYSISTLLTRNLHDVFGENDPARRRPAIVEIFTEDCVFYDPSRGVYRGRDEIDRVAGAIRATSLTQTSMSAGMSTIGPREVLMSLADGFIACNLAAPTSPSFWG